MPVAKAADPETERICQEAVEWVRAAFDCPMTAVSARIARGPRWPDVWPGEHYRLLAGMVAGARPRLIIEIGTHTGLSALAMLQRLQPGAEIVTFDVVPWRDFADTCLRETDFSGGRLRQIVGDLSQASEFARHAGLIGAADMIFVDGPKDGVFEPAFLAALDRVSFARRPLLVLDDIRFPNMVALWERIAAPKLDLTSFGHWSGTGVVRCRKGMMC
jgi:predicted O-methyltransferase YrrM